MVDTTVRVPNTPQELFKPRRLHGLRMPVLPTGSWLAQVGGGIATLAGTYMQWGIGATLIAGGAAAVVLGMLREAGKV